MHWLNTSTKNQKAVSKVDGRVYPNKQNNWKGWTSTSESFYWLSDWIFDWPATLKYIIKEIHWRDSNPQNCFWDYGAVKLVTGR